MNASQEQIGSLALWLREAERAGTRIEPIRTELRALDLQSAYAIQKANTDQALAPNTHVESELPSRGRVGFRME